MTHERTLKLSVRQKGIRTPGRGKNSRLEKQFVDKMYVCSILPLLINEKGVTLLSPPFSFSWTRDGAHFKIEEHPNVNMRPNSGTLEVDITKRRAESFEGVYQCTAENKHGKAVSDNIVVRQSSKCILSVPFPV